MLGYEVYRFNIFQLKTYVHNLDEYLTEVDRFNCQQFEHIMNMIAFKIARGLDYLHNNDIAHRDLKHGNILVSNIQLYNKDLTEDARACLYKTNSIYVKFTDFGESFGNLSLATKMMKSRTYNANRGTAMFNAPEQFNSDSNRVGITLNSLKMIDVYSFGLTDFCLVNPDLRVPYLNEWRLSGQREFESFLETKIQNGVPPLCSQNMNNK